MASKHRSTALGASLYLLVHWALAVQGDGGVAQLPLVRTHQGAVRGRFQAASSGRQIVAFYNLPYARPPVGELRFRDPEPPESWVHIRDATTPGPDCVQYDDLFLRTGITGAEDCLYLNVFTPKLSHVDLLPVMVWFHGGGWFYGGANSYGPDYLLNHDVLLVTANYRLGPFGFLSTEDEAAPGNFGLKDQLAVLRWVQDNIAAFGGEPQNVTIFGESAGAASSHFLALSPLGKGLFHRVIMQSGSALSPWALVRKGEAASRAAKLAGALGCPNDTSSALVSCLRNTDDYKVLGAVKHLKKWGPNPVVVLPPVVEGERHGSVLPKHPLHLKPADVDWVIGVTDKEGGVLTAGLYGTNEVKAEFEANFNRLLPITLLFDTVPNASDITDRIRNFYFPSGRFSLGTMTDLYSDALIIWSSYEAATLCKNMSSVFFYLLSYKGKYRTADPFRNSDFEFDAGHTDDLFYLFPKNPFYPGDYELPDEDMKMVHTMTKLWTNFARTGHPTPDGDPLDWPKVASDDELEYVEINKELKIKKGLAKERMDFWRSLPLTRSEETTGHLKEEL